MSSIDDILANIPINSLADQLGVDPATAESAVREALPALVGGMQANAADPQGAASLAGALDNHSPKLVDGGVNLDDVDTGDGEKIVSHVFGENTGAVAQTLGGNLGGNGDLIKKLLPILAPIVLSYLSQKMRGGAGQQARRAGGGLDDLLGSDPRRHVRRSGGPGWAEQRWRFDPRHARRSARRRQALGLVTPSARPPRRPRECGRRHRRRPAGSPRRPAARTDRARSSPRSGSSAHGSKDRTPSGTSATQLSVPSPRAGLRRRSASTAR